MDYDAALAAAVELLTRPYDGFSPKERGAMMFADPPDGMSFHLLHIPETVLPGIIEASKRDPNFKLAVLKLAADVIENGSAMPPALRPFAAAFLRGGAKVSKKRGPPSRPNGERNLRVALAVELVRHDYGFRPTRNAENKTGHSACSIVSAALDRVSKPWKMDERTVEEHWRGHAQFHRKLDRTTS